MISTSQAGQDLYVKAVLIDTGIVPRNGTFLDVGCGGKSISNTLSLEREYGYLGWLIDNSPEAKKDSADRRSTFMLADATKLDYSFLPPIVDYLSLDVDEASLGALKALPLDTTKFRVITAEHDRYRFGDSLYMPMMEHLLYAGYYILCSDVCNPESFEVWAVHRELVPQEAWQRFYRPYRAKWQDILA